jgi:hypothetical protein
VNTGAPWPDAEQAEARVLGIQTKLHRWATDDPKRRFDDLYNLVYDPAVLLVAWRRVRGNKGARSAGVDGETARSIEAGRGVGALLSDLRAELKTRRFAPLPVRERLIPSAAESGAGWGLPRWLQTAPPAGVVGVGGVRWAESVIFWRQAASTSGPKGTHQRPAGVRRAWSWPCWTQ